MIPKRPSGSAVEAGEGRVYTARLSLAGAYLKSYLALTWFRVGRVIVCLLIGAFGLPGRIEARAIEGTVSLPARLDGGSKGVPSHLPGTIYVSTGRVEFHAFPQVEDLVWGCREVGDLGKESRSGAIVRVEVSGSVYRINLLSPRQATAFVNASTSACAKGND
jgi:hypothetical protein